MVKTNELTPKQKANRLKKRMLEVESEKNQREVKSLTIGIERKKSRTWGMNPHASVQIEYKNGDNRFYRDEGFTASGYGYDKESTVIAEIFNKYLKYKLYQKRELKSRINGKEEAHPYGVYYYNGITENREDGYMFKPSYDGGVGTSCYYKISEFIGGKFESVANGKTFGVFKYTDND